MDIMSARNGSLIAKYVAAIILVLGGIAVGLGWLKLGIWDVATVSLGILAIFGTVDINLMLEKAFGRKA